VQFTVDDTAQNIGERGRKDRRERLDTCAEGAALPTETAR
jgi:hypothetical protein